MRRVLLGREGLQVSAIGLGAWGLSGDYGPADEAESIETVRHALDLGVTLVDTADEYGDGQNERVVGKAIRGRRGEVVVATKAGLVRGPDGAPSACGRPGHLAAALEGSLQRLGVDAVDLFYLHRVDPDVPIEESVGAMAELVGEGKARFLGLCEVGVELVRRAQAVHPLAAVQSEYSLWTRDPEEEVLPLLRELGIGFVAFGPLGRGFLTAAFRSPDAFGPGDFRRGLPRFQEGNLRYNLELLRPLSELAAEKGASPAQLALAWLLHRGVIPIPGTRRRSHVEDNLGALEIDLADGDLTRLEGAFPLDAAAGARYPPTMGVLAGANGEAGCAS